MWLVNTKKETSLELFLESELPRYAILSHTWGQDEVSFQDMQSMFRRPRQGWAKIKSACEQAEKDGFNYLWADTCCIDKTSSAELQEAINSMFRWYEKAAVCYVYLSDVQCPVMTDNWAKLQVPGERREIRITGAKLERWKRIFAESRWFTRGWTLQELIAPSDCIFFNLDWSVIGTKKRLIRTISQITRVEPSVLTRETDLSSISVAKRMSWAARRQTSRVEDMAYSLLGIFDVNIPMLYGEGSKAFLRLQEEIIKTSTDHSIFAWESTDAHHTGNLLAESPANFASADKIIQLGQPESFDITNRGLRIALLSQPLASVSLNRNHTWAALNCRFENDISGVVALRLTRYSEGDEYHTIRQDDQMEGPPSNQPWDLDSAVKFGPDSRLAFIKTKHLIHSVKSPMNITKKYEPRHSPVVFTVETGEDTGDTTEVYPQHIWSVEDGIVNTKKQTRMRAGLLISRNAGEQWVVTFGFDHDDEATHDSLTPHLSAQIYTGTDSIRDICELSTSYALLDRVDRKTLVAKAPSNSQPGQLLVSLLRSEIMGTIVYAVRIDFSGRFPELDADDTQRFFVELDAIETSRAVHLSSHEKIIDNALIARLTERGLYLKKQWVLADRLPLLGSEIKFRLWIKLHGDGFKLREIFPRDEVYLQEDIVAYSSSSSKTLTLGMLIESPDGALYSVFIYHGYQQRSHMPLKRTLSGPVANTKTGLSPNLLDNDQACEQTTTREENPMPGQDPTPDGVPGPDKDLTSDGNSESKRRPVPGENLEPEGKILSQNSPAEEENPKPEHIEGLGDRSTPAAIRDAGHASSISPTSIFPDEPKESDASILNVNALGPRASNPGERRRNVGDAPVPERGTGGVLAWLHTSQDSLREMTEAIENCNRGMGLCGNAYHDRTSHPYTFAKVVVNNVSQLQVNMFPNPVSATAAISVDIDIAPSNKGVERQDRADIADMATVITGSNQNTLAPSQGPSSEDVVADKRQDPSVNFADRGTDFSTYSGLHTGVEMDILGTNEEQT